MSGGLFAPGEFDAFLSPGGALTGAFARELRQSVAPHGLPAEGTLVGRWRVLREVGRGGMSVVFLAERADGAFRQQAALKLLHGAGGDDEQRYFERERQILASLNHPHIARLLDGGFEPGLGSYIVIEYVEGRPIDRYCDQARLGLRERLELFAVVCDAVSYAHRSLVVHRDIKPSNVLVTADGQVKLLDFGIAKLIDPLPASAAGDERPATRHLMTPAYAAPEQLRGETVTTATDVYQLGLLLYEILTGRRAQDPGRGALTDMVRAVCHEEPARPSDVARLARPALSRALQGDLDTIVLTALRKEPERRYASPADLARDLHRFRVGLPVVARRGSLRYRAVKFVRRHRLAVAAAALVIGSLAGGLGAALWQARVARREARRAEEVKHVLLSLFNAANPDRSENAQVSARELIQRGVQRMEGLQGQPEVLAELLWVAGVCYHRLGLHDDAAPLLERALALRLQVHGAGSVEVAEARGSLGELAYGRGRHAEALEHLGAAVALLETRADADPETVSGLVAVRADAFAALGRIDEGLALLHARLAAEERERPDAAGTAQLVAEIGTLLDEKGERVAAQAWHQRAIAIEERAGRRSQVLSQALHNLAAARYEDGHYAEAEALLRRALENQERSLGPDNISVVSTRGHLGLLLERKGDLDAAEAAYREALAKFRAGRGPRHPVTIEFAGLLGRLLARGGRAREALPLLREAHAAHQQDPDAYAEEERAGVAQALADLATATATAAGGLGGAVSPAPPRHN